MSAEDFFALYDRGQVNVLDIREPEEIDISSLHASINIPMMEIEDKVEELNTNLLGNDHPTIVLCRSGVRSETVTRFLIELGYQNFYNLSGGVNGLSKLRKEIKSY